MSTDQHVPLKRLLDLAQMPYVFDQPEWHHIRKCVGCLDTLATLVVDWNGESAPLKTDPRKKDE